MSAAQQVSGWIKERPFIVYALRKDLVNFSSLARMIQKDTGIRNFDAVIVAIRRYQKTIDVVTATGKEIIDVLKKSKLEIKTGVNVYIVKNTNDIGTPYLHLIKGSAASTVITEERLSIDIDCVRKKENMLEVRIISPPDVEASTGFIAHVCSALAERDINIEELYSCYTDTIFIFEKKDLSAVVEALGSIGVR